MKRSTTASIDRSQLPLLLEFSASDYSQDPCNTLPCECSGMDSEQRSAAAGDAALQSPNAGKDNHLRWGTATAPVTTFRIPRAQSAIVPGAAPVLTTEEQHRRRHKTVNLGMNLTPEVKVAVIAPGGGTGINGSVYSKLNQKNDISLQVVGQSRAPYDRYTEAWGPASGGPAPNLQSFAADVVSQDTLKSCDCLVVGSRGGQVCLPTFWQMKGSDVPPAVVLNGGCAMQLPIHVPWPDSAVSFVLLGGQDYFRQQFTLDQYLHDAKSRVPHSNSTTAIMLVHEMVHMPQAQLLDAILYHIVKAVTQWKEDPEAVPNAEFERIVAAVSAIGFHGTLTYKTGLGDAWEVTSTSDIAAGLHATRPQAQTSNKVTVMRRAEPIHFD